MRAPSHNPITLRFGATTDPYTPSSPHRGTDFSYLPDDIIYAPFAGKVVQVPNNGNDGNGSYMTESNGRFHGMLHNSEYLVPNNSQVPEGHPIAVMGSTGYAFGKHLHWCVRENEVFIDPMSLIEEEPMFNEGDRANINIYLYGEDKGYFKGQVNKPWKDAIYDLLNQGSELDFEYKVNDGDVSNINALLNVSDASVVKAQNWKDTFYKYVAAKFDEKNKIIAASQLAQGDVEATTIGKALIKLFQTFGYKKQ
jgi:hypothetical protein